MSFEEPFHFQFKAVDHPLVFRLHVLDVQDLFQLLKPGVEIEKMKMKTIKYKCNRLSWHRQQPGQVLEGMRCVPQVLVRCLQLLSQGLAQKVNLSFPFA